MTKPTAAEPTAAEPTAAEPEAAEPEAAEPEAAAEPDVEELEQTWQQGGEGKWEAWAQLRSIYAERGESEKLWGGMERAVEEGSPDWSDYANYGNRLLNEGKAEEALAVYEKGLKLEPDVYILLFGKGSALMFLDRKQAAIDTFEKALAAARQESSKQEMHLMIGRLLYEQGRFKQARSHFQALEPDFITGTTQMTCDIQAIKEEAAGEEMPPNFAFIERATVRQSAALASFKLRTGEKDDARQILSQLVDCGVSRQRLNKLFNLERLIRRNNIEL